MAKLEKDLDGDQEQYDNMYRDQMGLVMAREDDLLERDAEKG